NEAIPPLQPRRPWPIPDRESRISKTHEERSDHALPRLQVLGHLEERQHVLAEELGRRHHSQRDEEEQEAIFQHRRARFIGGDPLSGVSDRTQGLALHSPEWTNPLACSSQERGSARDANPRIEVASVQTEPATVLKSVETLVPRVLAATATTMAIS